MCIKPMRVGSAEFGCGQCMPCRINRRRVWTSRLLLESAKHRYSYFVTLTYDQEHLPEKGSLNPEHLKLFLKRLRKRLEPTRIRYFAVGEYGDHTWRPHYHLILFGGPIRDEDIKESWGLGHIKMGTCNQESIGYTAGYVNKKLTNAQDEKLQGRYPEFARMSRMPGIGCTATEDLGRVYTTVHGCNYLLQNGDVPTNYKSDGKWWPLGKYLRSKLRQECGWGPKIPEDKYYELQLQKREEYYLDGEAKRKAKKQYARNRAVRFESQRKAGRKL